MTPYAPPQSSRRARPSNSSQDSRAIKKDSNYKLIVIGIRIEGLLSLPTTSRKRQPPTHHFYAFLITQSLGVSPYSYKPGKFIQLGPKWYNAGSERQYSRCSASEPPRRKCFNNPYP
jgi:hypothetical protein